MLSSAIAYLWLTIPMAIALVWLDEDSASPGKGDFLQQWGESERGSKAHWL